MNSMDVLQVNKLYYPHIGGIESHLYLLCNELAKAPGFDVSALVCNTEFKTAIENINEVRLVRAASPGSFLGMPYAPSLPVWLRRLEADIIHFHHPFPPGEIAFLLTKQKRRTVVSWHSDIVKQKLGAVVYKPLLLKFLNEMDRILVASPDYLSASSYLGGFKSKCRVIPYGIDIERFRLTTKARSIVAQLREQHGPRIILFVGRLVYYKGLEYLIRAMRNIEGKLLIIGEGPLKGRLRERVVGSGLRGKVQIVGAVTDEVLPAYYHACDVFVLPSTEISEAFGIVQLEAMACGRPVVSSRLPTGVSFVNQHKKTGLLAPPGDASALAQAINKLLGDPRLRDAYGSYGKKRVEREFTKESMARKVMDIYDELMD